MDIVLESWDFFLFFRVVIRLIWIILKMTFLTFWPRSDLDFANISTTNHPILKMDTVLESWDFFLFFRVVTRPIWSILENDLFDLLTSIWPPGNQNILMTNQFSDLEGLPNKMWPLNCNYALNLRVHRQKSEKLCCFYKKMTFWPKYFHNFSTIFENFKTIACALILSSIYIPKLL